jgi:hypothetical protein
MKSVSKLLAAAVFTLWLCGTGIASETETCICRNGIVSRGDILAEVVKKCGEPAQSYQREEKRVEIVRGIKTISTVAIDDWTYNFGPNEFMHRILFENGRVVRIESLDYGY